MPLDLATLEVSRLRRNDDVSTFASTDSNVDDFLKGLAWTYQEENMGVSFLARSGSELVGYFTIAAGRLRVEKLETRDKVQDLEDMEYYPALLIGQLAVDSRYEKQGIGGRMLQMVYGVAVELQLKIGVRFLLLNATQASLGWWTRRGFTPLRDQKNRELRFLYLDVRKMER